MSPPADVEVGFEIPLWDMPSVRPERMRTMAAILRDPNPIHWDRREGAARGLGDHTVNQGPLNLGYVINMLIAWAGPTSIRRLQTRFLLPVLDHDHVTARGVVTAIDGGVATCDTWLERDGERVLECVATVDLGGAGSEG